jgi:hypothetical protein
MLFVHPQRFLEDDQKLFSEPTIMAVAFKVSNDPLMTYAAVAGTRGKAG